MGWHDTSSQLSLCDTVTSSRMVYGLARHIITVVFKKQCKIIVGGQAGSVAATVGRLLLCDQVSWWYNGSLGSSEHR